jgi:hypothetical protein
MNRLTKISIAVAVVAALLWVSTEDHKHEVDSFNQYIDNVCKGYHPDYDNVQPNCEGIR